MMQDLIRHKGKLNFGSGYIYFLNTGQDNRYVIQNGLLENTRHGRNAGMTKLALLFTKERI